ncbi:hypothetical protein ABKV19_004663 [Rosa sericea]
MFKITPNKVCIKAGVVDALNAMQKHVHEKVKKRLDKEKPFSVLNVSFDVFIKLVRVDDETECLITGWDETLERFDLWHAHPFPPTELKSVENYQACGTGRFYALKMLKQFIRYNFILLTQYFTRYEPNMCVGEAEEVAIRCLLEAGFYEPCTGGALKVCCRTEFSTARDKGVGNDETPNKMFKITPNKVCIKAGVVDALNAMQKHVQEMKRLDKEKPFSVLNVSFDVFIKLVRVDDETECLITGWDETLERFDLWHAHPFPPTELKSVENYQACGTGRFYALKMLKQL